MILEGFDIENCACIRKLNIAGLPPTGVIVLYGKNRTGKSTIVRALRACLMDYPSTSKAQGIISLNPKGTAERPAVSVTFQSAGAMYRIKKCFGTNKSELASRTPAGAWKVETADAGEAHRRTCAYVGGDDSNAGLHQLLWLAQAEFRLPDRKKLDPTLQGQLRAVLGVLQTALDDRFIVSVRERWSAWHSGQRKPSKEPALKDACKLAKDLARLQQAQRELDEGEVKYDEVERLLRQSVELELHAFDLRRQHANCAAELQAIQEKRQQSQERIRARQQAESQHAAAKKERKAAVEEQSQRDQAATRLSEDEKAVQPAEKNLEMREQNAKTLEEQCGRERQQFTKQQEGRRLLQGRAGQVAEKLKLLDCKEKLAVADEDLKRAQGVSDAIEDLEKYLAKHPAPDKSELDFLKDNRRTHSRLQAGRDAASMNLILRPEAGAGAAQIVLDGDTARDISSDDGTSVYQVRRMAALRISGWGQVEVSRGTESGDFDKIEQELRHCIEEFRDAVAPFGVAANEPNALDQLVERAAECRLKRTELDKQKIELKKLAPKGLEPLQARVLELRARLDDAGSACEDADPLPTDRGALEQLATELQGQLEALDADLAAFADAQTESEARLIQAREDVTSAKEALAAIRATTKRSREVLAAMRSGDEILRRVENATDALTRAQLLLEQTELTPEEATIDDRVAVADEAVRGVAAQLEENTRKHEFIKGRLRESEGLHARRNSLAARVDELSRCTQRESLERAAIDRLYQLFDDCREKQLDVLMGPIQNRILGWMRVLDIGDYREVRFGETFLPERLLNRDGTAEFTVDEESTGAQEQIGMLVRLALGSTLSSDSEPAVAVLDDPLTHCDIGRLNKMRVILRKAAEGDLKQTPRAGPLQIIILTCHPEWFRGDGAVVVDLEDPAIMSRYHV